MFLGALLNKSKRKYAEENYVHPIFSVELERGHHFGHLYFQFVPETKLIVMRSGRKIAELNDDEIGSENVIQAIAEDISCYTCYPASA